VGRCLRGGWHSPKAAAVLKNEHGASVVCHEAKEAISCQAVAIFDLDRTLISYDTFPRFLFYCARQNLTRFFRCSVFLFIDFIRFKLGLRDNTWLKTRFLMAVLGGVKDGELRRLAVGFVDRILHNGIRDGAIDELRRHQAVGNRTILLSASPDIYVPEIAIRLGFSQWLCTTCERDAWGRLTGRLASTNCYGVEKRRRLEEELGQGRKKLRVIVYADHASDLALMTWADEAVLVNPSRITRKTLANQHLKVATW
jgi:HAD superfamily hydrolase (TIGR01490 family)